MEGLASRGHTNVLACPVEAEIAGHAKAFAAVEPMRMGGDADVGVAFRLASLFRRERPDVVHVHSRRGADVWGGVAARMCGVPCVVSRRVDNREAALWARAKYGMYDHVVTISEEIRRVLLSEGLRPEKVTCVRSAVDAGPYLHAVDRAAFAREFGVPEGALVVGIVAQLIQRKGHRYLIEAIAGLTREFPTMRLVIFGKGPLERAIRASVQERRLDDVVRFAGFRDDLPKWLGGVDVLVHPAEIEGLGVALLQASAAGVPIVTSRAGGMPEAVVDGVTGVLAEVGDVAGIAAALRGLLADGELRQRLGEAGRARILAEFSISAMIEGNERVYGELLKRG